MMKRILMVSFLAASVVACDPYGSYDFKTGTPNIQTVAMLSHGSGLGFSGTVSSGAWTVDAGCAAVCAQIGSGENPLDYFDPGLEAAPMSNVVMFVVFDRQIDGAAVQTALDDCTPSSDWLNVSGATLAAGDVWQSCYSPGSPTDVEGGSAVLFVNAGATDGWAGSADLPDPTTAPDVVFTGTVAGATINVTLHREDLTACYPANAGLCP